MPTPTRTTHISSTNPFFVGRDAELTRFYELLDDPRGRVAVIVGQQGFGKTSLARECLDIAERHPNTCHSLWFEVITEDTAAAIMERMLEEAFAGAGLEGSFAPSKKRKQQWAALVEVLPKGKEFLTLLQALKAQPQRPIRERLAAALEEISDRLPENERLILVMDPEKYLSPGSAETWTAFFRHLPSKVLFLVPQRPDDELAQHDEFLRLACRLPKKALEKLNADAVDELVAAKLHDVRDLALPKDEILGAVQRYQGHPYAVTAALELVTERREEDRLASTDLPPDPAGIAAEQWKRIQRESADLAKVFEAHAVLEVPVPMDVVCAVAEVEPATYRQVLAHPYLDGLLSRHEGNHHRIYHSLLSEYVLRQLVQGEVQAYHRLACNVYRQRLENSTPKDVLAALRLPEHVLAVDGEVAFATVVAAQSSRVLFAVGLLEEALALLQRARPWAEAGSRVELGVLNGLGSVAWKRNEFKVAEAHFQAILDLASEEDAAARAIAVGNMGLLYQARGELERAEEMILEALQIYEELGDQAGMAGRLTNLGAIYGLRGEMERAEQTIRRAVEIDQQLGNRAGVAAHLGNLGVIYLQRAEEERAEQMFWQALEICESLGLAEEIAHNHTRLGRVYMARGNLETARRFWQKALPLYEEMGSPWAEKVRRGLAELDG